MEYLKNKFCDAPWTFLTIGDSYTSQCCYTKKILPPLKNEDIYTSWNSEDAVEVRKSILDGSFKYCKLDLCPHIQSNQLLNRTDVDEKFKNIIKNNILKMNELPSYIHLCNDNSCNFNCISCRKEKHLNEHSNQWLNDNLLFLNNLVKLIKKEDKDIIINITGSGDPFASLLYRTFLCSLDGEGIPNLKIGLQTNGSLLTPEMWNKISKIHKNIHHILISFDAITEKTYNNIRYGGNWKVLLKNFYALLNNIQREELSLEIELSFVVQRKNYKELPSFIKFCVENNVRPGLYLIYKWYDSVYFDDAMVYKKEHPEYNQFIEVINSEEANKYNINWGNLTQFRK